MLTLQELADAVPPNTTHTLHKSPGLLALLDGEGKRGQVQYPARSAVLVDLMRAIRAAGYKLEDAAVHANTLASVYTAHLRGHGPELTHSRFAVIESDQMAMGGQGGATYTVADLSEIVTVGVVVISVIDLSAAARQASDTVRAMAMEVA